MKIKTNSKAISFMLYGSKQKAVIRFLKKHSEAFIAYKHPDLKLENEPVSVSIAGIKHYSAARYDKYLDRKRYPWSKLKKNYENNGPVFVACIADDFLKTYYRIVKHNYYSLPECILTSAIIFHKNNIKASRFDTLYHKLIGLDIQMEDLIDYKNLEQLTW
jgi:hypothetical protein